MARDTSNPNQATQYPQTGGNTSNPNQATQYPQTGGNISNPNQATQYLQLGGDTSNPNQVTQHLEMGGDTLNPKILILMTLQKLSTLQGGRHFKPPHLETNNPKPKSTEISTFWIISSSPSSLRKV